MYAQVVFPMPFKTAFTYSIPEEFSNSVKVGVRVIVPFGKRTLTGFVIGLSETAGTKAKIKAVQDVLDAVPVFNETDLKFYEWIAEYYLSSLGEALKNSVPYGLEVESKKIIYPNRVICQELLEKESKKGTIKQKLLSVLSRKDFITIPQLQKEVKKKSIYHLLQSLEKLNAVTIVSQIQEAKVRAKKILFVKLVLSPEEIYPLLPELERRSPKQIAVLLELFKTKGEIPLAELLRKTGASHSSVKALAEKRRLIKIFEKEVDRVYKETYTEVQKEIQITDEQKEVVERVSAEVENSNFKVFLLHGVTGSGKTQVYIELTKKALEKGKSALILVPEISLTPQITSRFFNIFGPQVAVVHSKISYGERYDAWRGIMKGKYKIVIGPRSALFAPLKNLGLIVVDEEHDSSYKQFDLAPKYNARDAATIKAKLSACPILLGSATPSIESMYNASIGKYELLKLTERVDNAVLPEIKLVNVIIEAKKKKMENVFSHELLFKIKERLERKEGVIILQNRRGFATQIYCEDCGEIIMCDKCSVPMVYHLKSNTIRCHYCGAVKDVPKVCPHCGSTNLKFFGTGTERVEDELLYHFPDIRIARVDSDTINKKGKLGNILNKFGKGEIDVLVGTQMVSKGLDFSNVTLVGVISAETTLWLPDFRADERTFQLLTQVAGRSGRSKTKGEVVIQTKNHKHFVLQKVLIHDYQGFYERELNLRKFNGYPPFTRLSLIETKDEDEKKSRRAINDFYKFLTEQKPPLSISYPHEAVIFRLKGEYRYQILIKSDKAKDPGGKILRTAIENALVKFNKVSAARTVKLYLDVDPQSVM